MYNVIRRLYKIISRVITFEQQYMFLIDLLIKLSDISLTYTDWYNLQPVLHVDATYSTESP
jgi:hypothetical protein